MSEHPIPSSSPRKQRHLTLVESETPPEKLEATLSLEFFDLTDTSMSDEEIALRAHHIAAETASPTVLRAIESSEHPKVIARRILEETHVQPDLDIVREKALADAGSLTELEKAEVAHALDIEQRFREATERIEAAAINRSTHDLVEILEKRMDKKGYYDTNALRVCMALQSGDEMARYKPHVIVAGRIIKTMLLLAEDESSATNPPK